MSAMPSGAPGCPERAFSMASTARIRRALAHCLRVGMKRFLHCCFLRMGKGGQAAAALRRSLEQITFENRHYQIYGAPTAARGGAHKQRRSVPYCGFQAVAAQRPGRTPLAAQAAAKAARRAP